LGNEHEWVRQGVDWLEFSVTTDGEAAEAVVELFNRYGRGQAVVETPVDCFEYELFQASAPVTVVVKTYLPLDGAAAEAQRRLEEGLWHLKQIYPIPDLVVRQMAEEDWSQAWKQQYHLLRVGRRTVIVPAWEAYESGSSDEVVIRLEPGMAFGTGLHPTTRLCLEALETQLAPGCRVLDVGTGSGVLAIAAAKLGAGAVLALDADPVAVTVAQENVQMNGVASQVTVQHGSLPGGDTVPTHFTANSRLDLLESGRFDLVLINILAPVIVGMAPALEARMQPEGRLVVAGLIDSQEADVVEALQAQRLLVVRRTQEVDWICLIAERG
jgi:ribosomal protein L11 methyltransferase